ncbi:PadR family transcriptional regulator [Arthrobacter sp. SLBN-112]|uniref:PadR family transcriptional regulator n=1 Tax=Arthrobacter sp. SLBN-112 TaxID=2768452 RepID=UPI0027AEFC1F|nr:PadR family transcriptional regulator [Arthrobacter sp. SLBN-112]MDQ0801457.1 PadR family transcriptional regulator AphA [Arthrobacter sp. SLBN-112]
MKFEEVLLALIARAPSSGYDLGRWLATEGQFIRANADQSQIYKTLNRLLKQGLIEFTIEERDGAPDAKVYTVTPAGGQHLREQTESQYVPPARWQEPDFTARLNCLVPLNPPTLIPLIETELAFRRDQVRRYRHRDRTVRLVPGIVPLDAEFVAELSDAVHNRGAAALDAWIEWLEQQHEKWTAYLATQAQEGARVS